MTDAMLASNARCVTCGSTLVPRLHEQVQLLACPSGHGVFLDDATLQTALRDRSDDRPLEEEAAAHGAMSSSSAEELAASEAARTCPVCGAEMSKRVFAYESGVTIDACNEHGVWLDEGELHRIEAWYEGQERHLDADRAVWGGPTGRLEQIEQQVERKQADDEGALHWGPFGKLITRVSYWWSRRDDAI